MDFNNQDRKNKHKKDKEEDFYSDEDMYFMPKNMKFPYMNHMCGCPYMHGMMYYKPMKKSCRYDYDYRGEAAYRRQARAIIKGGPLAPDLKGFVVFTDVPGGTEVYTEITGLPEFKPAKYGDPQIGPFGFHIHQYGNCTAGDPDMPFMASGGHWNPANQPHGNHAGDFPVLFSNGGRARMTFFTNKFKVNDIIGKSVIIHESPDDYKTQPAGNAGRRLACGVIIT